MAAFEPIGDIVSRIIPLLGEPLPDIYSERTEDFQGALIRTSMSALKLQRQDDDEADDVQEAVA